jgi:hypothetical protein
MQVPAVAMYRLLAPDQEAYTPVQCGMQAPEFGVSRVIENKGHYVLRINSKELVTCRDASTVLLVRDVVLLFAEGRGVLDVMQTFTADDRQYSTDILQCLYGVTKGAGENANRLALSDGVIGADTRRYAFEMLKARFSNVQTAQLTYDSCKDKKSKARNVDISQLVTALTASSSVSQAAIENRAYSAAVLLTAQSVCLGAQQFKVAVGYDCSDYLKFIKFGQQLPDTTLEQVHPSFKAFFIQCSISQ